MPHRTSLRVAAEAAGTQYSVTLPPLVLRLRVRLLNNIPAVVSLINGEVAAGAGIGVPSGDGWDSGQIRYTGAILYYAASQPRAELAIDVFTEAGLSSDDAAYDYGFDLGFES